METGKHQLPHQGEVPGCPYAGLIYPIVVAVISIVIGSMFIVESRHVKIWDEVGGHDEDRAVEVAGAATQATT